MQEAQPEEQVSVPTDSEESLQNLLLLADSSLQDPGSDNSSDVPALTESIDNTAAEVTSENDECTNTDGDAAASEAPQSSAAQHSNQYSAHLSSQRSTSAGKSLAFWALCTAADSCLKALQIATSSCFGHALQGRGQHV